jgi:hypothetical protein|tara:strand:+ start:2440 stop:2670 length:231 start_codon:yes stop_codon:yes gene_type:complete
MELNMYTHTLLALTFMAGCYCWGRYLTKFEILNDVIVSMLDRLESDGYIKTKRDKNGEKSLIRISEIKSEKSEISA